MSGQGVQMYLHDRTLYLDFEAQIPLPHLRRGEGYYLMTQFIHNILSPLKRVTLFYAQGFVQLGYSYDIRESPHFSPVWSFRQPPPYSEGGMFDYSKHLYISIYYY